MRARLAEPREADDATLRFVVEDLRNGRVVGAARLHAAIGLALPRYAYHVGCSVHASRELHLFHRLRTLYLSNDHTGACELTDIEVDAPQLADRAGALSLLVQAALMAIAERREAYAPQLVVALPGVRDHAGQSPFWAGLGRHFYAGDPAEAEREHGTAWKSHVAALMPRHTLYGSFLDAAAQAAIAQADPAAQTLREVLEHEGLRYGHHIDIADGGPILEAAVDDLRSVHASRRWKVAIGPAAEGGSMLLVANAATLATARVRARAEADALHLSSHDAQALGVLAGQWVRAAPLA